MSTYTRTLSTIAAAAIAVTTAVSVGAGQPPAGRGPGQGRGGFGGPLPMLRQLNLTDAQQEQIKTLAEEQRSQTTEQSPERKLGELRRALHAAVFADAPDTAQIDQLRSAIVEAEAAALASRVELQLKIAQVLTPEQRKQARELTDGRAGRAGRAEGPRGPRSGGIPHATRP